MRAEQTLIPSVLDRLLDDAPEQAAESGRNRVQLLRDLKVAVGRDLQDLLNTRRRNLIIPPGCGELERSLVSYGLPDLSGSGPVSSVERTALCGTLRTVIMRNEPRLLRVHVSLVTAEDPLDRTLRFRIEAMLRADPAPEPVVFDSVLESSTGEFAVQGASE
ncbi:MAG: type VI secretion system baseplate subunit TssE [Planctomycetes bacterium]|nr:type VI secretion system baseplate subunit TssE [Planctomycetota bacterium]